MEVKNKKGRLYVSLIPVFIVLIVSGFALYDVGFSSGSNTNVDGIQYKGTVCTSVTRADGTYEDNGCKSNLLTNQGANYIRDILGGGGVVTAFDYIGLCNATAGCIAPAAGDTGLENNFSVGTLARAQGTVDTLTGTGNWSVYKTFTADSDGMETNKTGLFNDSTEGGLLAENTFTLVTLQTNDQLTINWTITASDA